MLTFSMSRKYPFEFMTEQDHEMLYSKMKKPSMDSMVGIWEGYLISDFSWSPPVFKFRYYFDNGILKNDYIFGNILSGTAVVIDKEDHLEMQDVTGQFHDEILQVNENIVIGKYYSPGNELLRLIPVNISFLHSDPSRPESIFLTFSRGSVKIWLLQDSVMSNNEGPMLPFIGSLVVTLAKLLLLGNMSRSIYDERD